MSKEEFVACSNDGKKYKFGIEVINEDELSIDANEGNENVLFPKYYKVFRKEELYNLEGSKIIFRDTKTILEEIISSFNSNKLSFNIKESEIILSYFLFNKFKFSVNIPIRNNDITNKINNISSKVSNLINLSNKFKHILTQLSKNILRRKNNKNLTDSSLIEEINVKLNDINKNNNEVKINLNNISSQIKLNTNHLENLSKNNKSFFTKKIKLVKRIKNDYGIYSLCFLKDQRLVSVSTSDKIFDKKIQIVIYNKDSYEPNITIQEQGFNAFICGLKNGNLAASSLAGDNLFNSAYYIKIWEIEGDKYKLIHTLEGGKSKINKIIGLEDGKLCSCSDDKTIKIWDNNNEYQCIQTLTGHTNFVELILEMNNCIISVDGDKSVKIWDNSKNYGCIKTIKIMYYWNKKCLSRLDKNRIIFGGYSDLCILDTLNYKYKVLGNNVLKKIHSIYVLESYKILVGNEYGEIISFDLSSCQIIFIQKLHNKEVTSIIKNGDNIFSSSNDGTINIFKEEFELY